jgi:hypothetical protein
MGIELEVRSNPVPSYGGQLSAPAHKAGAASHSEAINLRDMLKEHAARLEKIALDFEKVDGETVEQINYWEILLQKLGDLIAKPDPNPFLDIDFEALYGRFHQNQKTPDGCADYSLLTVRHIFYEKEGKATSRCDVGKITGYSDRFFFRFPALDKEFLSRDFFLEGGATAWGVGFGLDSLGIPNTIKPDGSLEGLEDLLNQNKLVIVSIGQINDPDRNGETWGHVMVVVGMDGGDYLLLDPAYSPGAGEPRIRRIPKQELLEDWWYLPFHPCWIIG